MIETLAPAVLLGLSAGLTPGPLLALVISQSLRHGFSEGLKVALSPLLTDTPIILCCLLILSGWSGNRPALGALSLAGGAFVAWLGLGTLRTRGLAALPPGVAPRSLGKGALVNLLSPHPYLFWLMVGVPMLLKARAGGGFGVAAFLAGFFCCLIGSKVLVAWLSARSRGLLQGPAYLWTMRLLGALMLAFAALLARDGLRLLGVLGRAAGAAGLVFFLAAGPLLAAEPESKMVWRFPDQDRPEAKAFYACLDRGRGVAPCLKRLMRAAGATKEVLAASALAGGEAFVSRADPVGGAGLILAVYTHPARANENEVACILGGRPALVSTEFDPAALKIAEHPAWAGIRARFPSAELWTVGAEFVEIREEPGGGQALVFAYPLLDGCHACDRAGIALVAHLFDGRKAYRGPRLEGLEAAP